MTDKNEEDTTVSDKIWTESDDEESSNPNVNKEKSEMADSNVREEGCSKKNQNATGHSSDEVPKREENPFSFKHFLKRDSGNSVSYQGTGARPKIYSSQTANSYDQDDADPVSNCSHRSRNTTRQHSGTSEVSTVLPDFVQDHLVVEQCYLNSDDSNIPSTLSVDLENLPDFAVNGDCSGNSFCEEPRRRSHVNSSSPLLLDSTCDLTDSTPYRSSARQRNESPSIPLDLPNLERNLAPNPSHLNVENGGLPFDLPLVSDSRDRTNCSSPDEGIEFNELGMSKSLPDFLSDGPIHSDRRNDASPPNDIDFTTGLPSEHEAQVSRLTNENERLRRELDLARRQLVEQARRNQSLERRVSSYESQEHEEAAALDKAMKQVEDNLKRTTKRAITAENKASKLERDVEILNRKLCVLQRENEGLRMNNAGSSSAYQPPPPVEIRTHRIAQDLRAASDSAEQSLRQLLSGIGNLRIMASALENINKIQDPTESFIKDVNDDDDE